MTFVAPTGFLESADVDTRIDIPTSFFRHRTKIGARWSAIRVLSYILKNVSLENYDAIVFMGYETISFSICWHRNQKVFLFEHNNIENARGSWIKTFFYNKISINAVRLVFQDPIVKFIRETIGGDVVQIPHPYYRQDVSDSGIGPNGIVSSLRPEQPIVIFSPSNSTSQETQDRLKKFVSTTNGAYYATCKGCPAERTDAWEVRPFFDDYQGQMRTCDMVFVGACFDYRVSGVAYEALSYGKPIVLFDSIFARELYSKNPDIVFIIKKLEDILYIKINSKKIQDVHSQFLKKHSFYTIKTIIESALFKSNIRC